eukprot:scaffold161827_cov31-Tisochrysis_lutea.AAC.1
MRQKLCKMQCALKQARPCRVRWSAQSRCCTRLLTPPHSQIVRSSSGVGKPLYPVSGRGGELFAHAILPLAEGLQARKRFGHPVLEVECCAGRWRVILQAVAMLVGLEEHQTVAHLLALAAEVLLPPPARFGHVRLAPLLPAIELR